MLSEGLSGEMGSRCPEELLFADNLKSVGKEQWVFEENLEAWRGPLGSKFLSEC